MTNITKPIGKRNRLVSKEEAKAMLRRYDVEKSEIEEKVEKKIVITQPYMEIEWENNVPKDGIWKRSMTFEQHLERLKQEGWDRAPSPQEYISLMIDYYEGKMSDKYKVLIENQEHGPGEFTNYFIMRVNKETIGLFADVTNVKIEKGKYILSPSDYLYDRCYKIEGLHAGSNYLKDINKTCPDFIKDFCTRSYEELPDMIKQGEIEIPYTNDTLYVLTFYCTEKLLMSAEDLSKQDERTSRGIKRKKKSKFEPITYLRTRR